VPKITDFGLAKHLANDSRQTRNGAVVGTPSYMAPEQAGGGAATVGPAADVYALGAVLYELLTGRPPFQAATVLETLEQVKSVEPVPPRRLRPKLSRDLETICLKCLEKDPGKRYASAGALADDLRRFRNHEPIRARPVGVGGRLRRWCRRNPKVALLTGALVLVAGCALAAVTGLWLHADQLRAEAVQNFREAKTNLEGQRREYARAEKNFSALYRAVDQYYLRVSQERLLNEPGMEGLRKELLKKSLKFYRGFVAEHRDNPELQRQCGRAYLRLAKITLEIGSKTEAIALLRRGRAVFERLRSARPRDRRRQSNLGQACQQLGVVYLAAGRTSTAEKSLRRALALLSPLGPGRTPVDRTNFGQTYASLAELYKTTGRLDRAEKAYRRAVAVFESLAREHRTSAQLHDCLSAVYNNFALFSHGIGRLGRAEKLYRQVARFQSVLVRGLPQVAEYRYGLALCRNNLGILYRDTGRFPLAAKSYRQAIELYERLLLDHPRVTRYRAHLGEAHGNLGVVYQVGGRLALAEKSLRRALPLQEEVVRTHPDTPEYRRAWGDVCNNLATVYVQTGRLKLAEKKLREARVVFDRLVRKHPTVASYRNLLAMVYTNLGMVYQESGRPRRGAAACSRALAVLAPLLKPAPGPAAYRASLGQAFINLGGCRLAAKQTLLASVALRRAVAVYERLRRAFPKVADYRHFLAFAYRNLGLSYQAAGRWTRAETSFQQSLRLCKRLVQDCPHTPIYQNARGNSHTLLGNLLAGRGRWAEAEAEFREALAARRALVREDRDRVAFAVQLGGDYCNLGNVQGKRGNPAAARESYDRGVRTLEEVLRRVPGHGQARRYLGNTLGGRAAVEIEQSRYREAVADLDRLVKLSEGRRRVNARIIRAYALAKAGDHARAAAEADDLLGVLGPMPQDFLLVASAYAVAGEAAARDAALKDRDKLAEKYVGRAVQLLQKAKAAGSFRTPAAGAGLRSNPDFRPLRKHPGFKKLLAEGERPTDVRNR
jgi:tetratricopeptide (TPR) repeat protein